MLSLPWLLPAHPAPPERVVTDCGVLVVAGPGDRALLGVYSQVHPVIAHCSIWVWLLSARGLPRVGLWGLWMPWWLTLALLTSSVWDAPLPELQNPTAEEGHAVLLLDSSGKSSCTSEATIHLQLLHQHGLWASFLSEPARGARISHQHAFPKRWTLSSQQCDCWEQIPLCPLPFPTSPCSIALVNGSHWELYSSVQKCWQQCPCLLRNCLHHLCFCPFQPRGPWCCWPWCLSPCKNWDCSESSCHLRMDFMSQRYRNTSSSPNMILTRYWLGDVLTRLLLSKCLLARSINTFLESDRINITCEVVRS